MKEILLLLISLTFLFSCKENSNKELVTSTGKITTNNIADSTTKTSYKLDYIELDTNNIVKSFDFNYLPIIESKLSNWITFNKAKSSSFDITQFQFDTAYQIHPYKFPIDSVEQNSFISIYKNYIKYSPDNSKLIDLYSYRYILNRDSNGTIGGMMDVDCKVAVINKKTNEHITLMTWGSSSDFQDGFWISNDTIAIAWIENDSQGSFVPRISIIDLKNYHMCNYKSNIVLTNNDQQYSDIVFKNINFE